MSAGGVSHGSRRARVAGSLLLVGAAVWAVVRSGVNLSPGLPEAHQTALIWPSALSSGFNDFYADSALGIVVYRALGFTSEYAYLLLGTAVALAAVSAWVVWAAWAAGEGMRLRAARLMVLAPLPAVILTWLGFYDPFTIAAWALCLGGWALGFRWLMALLGILLGFQHFEQTLMGAVALTLVWHAVRDDLPDPVRLRSPLWFVPGILLGKAILVTIMLSSGGAAAGRTGGIAPYLREWTIAAVNAAPTLLWALFAGSWAVVIAWWLHEPSGRARLLTLLAFAVATTGMMLTGDRPRVFVIVMAPALLILTISLLRSGRLEGRTLNLVEAVVWLAPPIALWGSDVIGEKALDQLIMTWHSLTGA